MENINLQTKNHSVKNKLVIYIGIGLILLLVLIFFIIIVQYLKNPEIKSGLGAEIKQAVVDDSGENLYIKRSGGVGKEKAGKKEIQAVVFKIKDKKGNEYYYETEKGTKELSVDYEKGFSDWLFGVDKYSGTYDYKINTKDVEGLDNFKDVKEIEVSYKYKQNNQQKNTKVLDKQKTKQKTEKEKPTPSRHTTSSSGSGSGSGGGGSSGSDSGSKEKKCGNNKIDNGEVCDGSDLNDSTCKSKGYDSGTLKCSKDCKSYNVSDCVKNPENSDSGLISYYNFENDAKDEQGKYDGVLEGNAEIVDDDVRGKVVSLLNLGDNVNFGDINEIDGTKELTLMTWIKLDTASLDKDVDIFSKGLHSGNQPLLIWRDDSSTSGEQKGNTNCLSGFIDDGPDVSWIGSSNDSLNDSEWHHIAISFKSGVSDGLKLYIDGVLEQTGDTTNVDNVEESDNVLRIGSTGNYAGAFFDDVRIYNKSLNNEEVKTIYDSENLAENPTPINNCSNNKIDNGEVCDGSDLNGVSCINLGYDSGILKCSQDCKSYDVSNCVIGADADYYVSVNGNGDCSKLNPCSLNYVMEHVNPGEIVFLMPGNYGSVNFNKGFGSKSGGYVTYKADPETTQPRPFDWYENSINRPNPENQVVFSSDSGSAITFPRRENDEKEVLPSYIKLENINIVDAKTNALYFDSYVSDVIIENCSIFGKWGDYVSDITSRGVFFRAIAGVEGKINNVKIENCYIEKVGQAIKMQPPMMNNISIKNNHLYQISSTAIRVEHDMGENVILDGNHINHQASLAADSGGSAIVDSVDMSEPKRIFTINSNDITHHDIVDITDSVSGKKEVRNIESYDSNTLQVILKNPLSFNIKNGDLVNFYDANHGSGINILGSNVVIKNNKIHDYGNTRGIWFPYYSENFTIENNLVYDIINLYTIDAGVISVSNKKNTFGDNIIIRNNTFVGRYRSSGKRFYGISAIFNFSGENPSSIEILNNIFVGTLTLKGNYNGAKIQNNIAYYSEQLEDGSVGNNKNNLIFYQGESAGNEPKPFHTKSGFFIGDNKLDETFETRTGYNLNNLFYPKMSSAACDGSVNGMPGVAVGALPCVEDSGNLGSLGVSAPLKNSHLKNRNSWTRIIGFFKKFFK